MSDPPSLVCMEEFAIRYQYRLKYIYGGLFGSQWEWKHDYIS